MRTLTVMENLTLDGVVQAPGRPDEDLRGDFEHGGWAAPYQAMGALLGERSGPPRDLLFGRRTYEGFAAFWPAQGADNPYTQALNAARKYVASRALDEPLPWANSVLLRGEAAATVAALKQSDGPDLLLMGSTDLVHTLQAHRLVDTYILLIHPLVLGSGRQLFPSDGVYSTLQLVQSRTTDTGVVIATYDRA